MTAAIAPETKRRVMAQISVCMGCCCGKTEKGKPEVPEDWLKQEWKERKLKGQVHLSISRCLGPCDIANVVCINTPAGSEWLGSISEQAEYEALLAWAQACADAGSLQPLPDLLATKRFRRWQE